MNFLGQKHIIVIEHPVYSLNHAVCKFWLFFNVEKKICSCLFHSEDEIDEVVKEYFHQFQGMDGLKHLIFEKSSYIIASILEGTILIIPKIT